MIDSHTTDDKDSNHFTVNGTCCPTNHPVKNFSLSQLKDIAASILNSYYTNGKWNEEKLESLQCWKKRTHRKQIRVIDAVLANMWSMHLFQIQTNREGFVALKQMGEELGRLRRK